MRSMAVVAAVVVAVGVGMWFGFQPERSGTVAFWAITTAPTLVLSVVALVWAKREEMLREWLTPRGGDFTLAFFGAAALFAVAWAFARLACPVGSTREVWLVSLYSQLGDPRVLQKHVAGVVAAIVVAAAAEEIVWRGFVTALLAERVGSRMAWIGSAGLYALAHVPTMWALRAGRGALNPLLPLAALGAGLVFGGLARLRGRLMPAIFAHVLFDWCAVMMFPLWGMRV
jgi:membrane protease YdiL (CAAX protease family)